jgi:hypothetical protein
MGSNLSRPTTLIAWEGLYLKKSSPTPRVFFYVSSKFFYCFSLFDACTLKRAGELLRDACYALEKNDFVLVRGDLG